MFSSVVGQAFRPAARATQRSIVRGLKTLTLDRAASPPRSLTRGPRGWTSRPVPDHSRRRHRARRDTKAPTEQSKREIHGSEQRQLCTPSAGLPLIEPIAKEPTKEQRQEQADSGQQPALRWRPSMFGFEGAPHNEGRHGHPDDSQRQGSTGHPPADAGPHDGHGSNRQHNRHAEMT